MLPDAHPSDPSPESQTAADELEFLDSMKGTQLKALCKERGLKMTGTKATLIERLREHFTNTAPVQDSQPQKDDLDSMTLADLRDAVVARGLPGRGTKKELLERYRQDIQMAKDIHEAAPPTGRDDYVALSRILEEAAKKEGSVLAEYMAEIKAKAATVPKFIDVTITSLGLVPDKYTVGGAPSVTSDVLRKLAGDPFSDPPKYGTVSSHEGHDILLFGSSFAHVYAGYHSTGS